MAPLSVKHHHRASNEATGITLECVEDSQLTRLLSDLEAPPIDDQSEGRLQRFLDRFGQEHVTLLVRTIIESEGNEGALVEPIVSAVSSLIIFHPKWTDRGLAWIEAFDKIPLVAIVETMRGLDLFKETSLAHYLSMILSNKLRKILEESPPPPNPKRRPMGSEAPVVWRPNLTA
jgi:hypothetical protein